MAELSEAFEVAKVGFSRNIFIETTKNHSCILVSSKENGFMKFTLDSRKVVQSWPMLQTKKLSTPAIHNHHTDEYLAVLDDKELCSWNESDTSLTEAELTILRISNPVVKLHTICHGNTHDILFVDNKSKKWLLSSLSNKFSGNSEAEDKTSDDKKRYIWSSVHENQDHYTSVFIITEEAQKYALHVTKVKEENGKLVFQESAGYAVDPVQKGSHIVGCTITKEKLAILWSDNSLCSYDLDLHTAKDAISKVATLERKVVAILPQEFKIAGKGFSKAKIGCIDSNHIFIVSKCIMDEKRQGIVSIWSLKFGTEQARILFPVSSNSDKSSKEQQLSSAIYHNNQIIFALTTTLMSCSCRIVSSSLASALGRLRSFRNDFSSKTRDLKQPAPLLVTSTLKRKIKDTDITKTNKVEELDRRKAVDRLSDPAKTASAEDFNRGLDSFLKKLRFVEKEEKTNKGDEPETKKKKKSLSKPNKNQLMPELFLETVINRCVADDDLWSSEAINKVLKTKCVSPRLCSKLIDKALESQSLGVLEQCFDCTIGVTERDIVRCIQYALGKKNEGDLWKKPEILKGNIQQDFVKLEAAAFQLLMTIFKYECNELAMQEALKVLSGNETKQLLQILLELLVRRTCLSEPELSISHEKVVDWISMITNAKFTAIILSNDMSQLIERLHKIIGDQMNFMEKLEALEPYLMCLKKRFEIPTVKSIGAYTVETIRI